MIDVAKRGGRPAPNVVDVCIAAGSFVLFSVPVLAGATPGQGPTAAIVVFGVLVALPLVVRRRAPVAVLATVAAVLVVAALSDVRFTPFVSNGGPALAIAVFTVADRLPVRAALRAGITAIAVVTAAELTAMAIHPGTAQDAIQLVTAVPAGLLGYLFGVRRRLGEQLRAREEQRAREEERRIRAEERLRVSADVHDIVSHTLSMIAVRSGVARVVLDEQPDEARVALGAIEDASRSALDELRAVLHALRDEVRVDAPSLADLPALVETLGLPVTLRVSPHVEVPPLVEEAAYRIVQEALTNVARHAGPVPVTVDVTGLADELRITVVNEAGSDSGTGSGSGFGLAGMQERVALHDGTVEAGPRPDGGFAVVARFPREAARA
ncbi:sensor histidine kinase [Cryptosporangium minutisporangium]|uniref:sensor histidine kinase n=1 Tax=Cryptosporangium minutisporangium TaxID=113569 RepID=UPI0031EB68EB